MGDSSGTGGDCPAISGGEQLVSNEVIHATDKAEQNGPHDERGQAGASSAGPTPSCGSVESSALDAVEADANKPNVEHADAFAAMVRQQWPELNIEEYLADTGTSVDILTQELAEPYPEGMIKRDIPLSINTAGGKSESTHEFAHRIPMLDSVSRATLLESTPAALSVGIRADKGYIFIWNGTYVPIWILPDGGSFLPLVVKTIIPCLVSGTVPIRFDSLLTRKRQSIMQFTCVYT